jgi:hypothetical protein
MIILVTILVARGPGLPQTGAALAKTTIGTIDGIIAGDPELSTIQSLCRAPRRVFSEPKTLAGIEERDLEQTATVVIDHATPDVDSAVAIFTERDCEIDPALENTHESPAHQARPRRGES